MASPAIVFWGFPWLMALLVIGTIAQKDLGLYKAHALYFSSWVFWAGPIPLPGTYAVLSLITFSLLIKFLFFSEWRMARAGTILTHLGVLVLLIGGILTALTQEEGYIALKEGESSAIISDYHDRIVRVSKEGEAPTDIPFESLEAGATISSLPFFVRVEMVCENCRPAPPRRENVQGLAREMSLVPAPPEKENEANLSGLMFSVEGTQSDGDYLIMEDILHKPEIKTENGVYRIEILRAQRKLPFSITLADFQRDMHPGMNMASGFSSEIRVEDDGVAWPALIRMNEPLRYKGYTLYQSSFALRPDGEVSIFSVVENKGRVFPYLASALIFAGLCMHIVLRAKKVKKT